MAFKLNKVSRDPFSYRHYIMGEQKTGKTTLFKDLGLIYNKGDATKALLISCGNEEGQAAIDGILFENAPCWSKLPTEDDETRGLVQIIDDIVENNDKYGLTMVALDTVDELIKIATDEVLKLSYQHNGKPVISLNEAFGGFSRGKVELFRILEEQLVKLESIGIKPFIIGHTKCKKKVDPYSGMEFEVVTSSLTEDVYKFFANKARFIATVTEDKIIENGRLIGTTRRIHFRTNGLVEGGTSFNKIPDSIPMDAQTYLDAVDYSVRAELGEDVGEFKPSKNSVVNTHENVDIQLGNDNFQDKLQETKNIINMKLKDKLLSKDDIVKVFGELGISTIDEISDIETLEKLKTELF